MLIKMRLQASADVHVSFGGRSVNMAHSLGEAGIQDGDTIHVHHRIRGGIMIKVKTLRCFRITINSS